MLADDRSLDRSRRNFLAGLSALGAAAGAATMIPSGALLAQAAKPKHRGVIDMHHHFWAPDYLKAQDDYQDRHHTPHYAAMQSWTPEVSLAEMDGAGVVTAILSLASISEGFWGLDAPAASRVVHSCDDYAAMMMSDHPGRFGLMAPLNMLDVDLSLKEIEYGLDQVHADSIGLNTSYNGKYPGDPSYNPIWEELNRRKAMVYLHGPNPACCIAAARGTGPGVDPSVLEAAFDVTRAVTSLLANGALVRYPDIKWILAYGGGTIPRLAKA